MVPLLANGQIQAALAAEQAGIQAHNLDPNVVIVGETMLGSRYLAIVGRDVPDIAAMRRAGIWWSYFVSWSGSKGLRRVSDEEIRAIYALPGVGRGLPDASPPGADVGPKAVPR